MIVWFVRLGLEFHNKRMNVMCVVVCSVDFTSKAYLAIENDSENHVCISL